MRRQILTSYVHFDLLEAALPAGNKGVFDNLFYSKSPKIKEYLVAFMNSLASEYQGRTYLLGRQNIVHLLVDTLYAEGNTDSYLRQNALGSLQKFSLRKQAQSTMIDCEVIRWIV